MGESVLEKVMQGWRGVNIADRPGLMRAMATRFGAPADAIDGSMLEQCVYCASTAACEAYLQTDQPAAQATFCPNARRFRASAVIREELS